MIAGSGSVITDVIPLGNEMARFKLRTLFVLVTIAALLLFWFLEPEEIRNNSFLSDPITTAITTRSDGHRYSDFKIYSNGDYGILEFGNLRIAVKGETFRDSGVGENVRFTGHKKVAGYDLVGHGIKFEKMTDAKGTHFQFVGLSFTMVNSKIKLLGESVQADGQPTLVLVRDGNAKVYTSDTIDFE